MRIRNLFFFVPLLALLTGTAKAQTEILPTEGFENDMNGWSFVGKSPAYGVLSADFFHTDYYSFRFKGSDTDYGYLISPAFDAGQVGVHVQFWHSTGYNSFSEFMVGYSMTDDDPFSFTWSALISSVVTWRLCEKDFPAGVKHVAIAFPMGYSHLFVDDISITTSSCAMPSVPVVQDVNANSVTVGWTGTANQLKYSSMDSYGFESGFDSWTMVGSGNSWLLSDDPAFEDLLSLESHNGSFCVGTELKANTYNKYLVSPEITLGGSITFFVEGYLDDGDELKDHHREVSPYAFKVMYSITGLDPDDFSDVDNEVYEVDEQTWKKYTIDLGSLSGNGYVAICPVFNSNNLKPDSEETKYYLFVDDITLYSHPGNVTVTGSSYTISSLTPETQYAVQLKGDCEDWTEPLYVATLPNGGVSEYRFVNHGAWSEPTNWENWYMPQGENDIVVLNARAKVPSNHIAKAGTITIGTNGSLTIADGGQLKHSILNYQITNNRKVVMEKNITGYTTPSGRDNYKLLAFPTTANIGINSTSTGIGSFASSENNNVFDLYKFDQSEDIEWINYEQPVNPEHPTIPDHPFTQIESCVGYLYANAESRKCSFNIYSLTPSNTTVNKTLVYSEGKAFSGWNLIGNPFACNAYVTNGETQVPFYRMNAAGDAIVLAAADNGGNVIAPMEGIFVQAGANLNAVTFTTTEPGNYTEGLFDFTVRKALSRTEGSLDRARVKFGEGQNMGHLDLMADPNRLYIPLEGNAMSVVYSQPVGELPINFEAASDETFVLGFTNKAEDLAYCHLIDNLTGVDVDLLQHHEYTFNAKVSDYPSRFRVVFVAKDSEDIAEGSETFAFNSYGNWIIANEGLATLQVVDMQGRIISNETIEGCVSKTIHAVPGVYVLRLVNGENVKVQKIIIK